MLPPSDKNDPAKNPHAAAAGAYGASAQKHTPDQRELEGHVLLKSAKFLQDLQNDWDNVTTDILEQTLKYNRQIWMLFYDAALENPEGDRPNDLRSNIINLSNFVFKRELDIMADPQKEKLTSLISINREIAAGLMTKQKVESKDDTPLSDSVSDSA
ncbi:MAG: flagellar FlaF family protein [Alphaproteobacteria bacterium]|nr:flagellar FlaF family protein [Alphaproteobacteria bacterium]